MFESRLAINSEFNTHGLCLWVVVTSVNLLSCQNGLVYLSFLPTLNQSKLISMHLSIMLGISYKDNVETRVTLKTKRIFVKIWFHSRLHFFWSMSFECFQYKHHIYCSAEFLSWIFKYESFSKSAYSFD